MARRLIKDDSYRIDLSNRILKLREQPFFTAEVTEQQQFLKTFNWMLENHSLIAVFEDRVWPLAKQMD